MREQLALGRPVRGDVGIIATGETKSKYDKRRLLLITHSSCESIVKGITSGLPPHPNSHRYKMKSSKNTNKGNHAALSIFSYFCVNRSRAGRWLGAIPRLESAASYRQAGHVLRAIAEPHRFRTLRHQRCAYTVYRGLARALPRTAHGAARDQHRSQFADRLERAFLYVRKRRLGGRIVRLFRPGRQPRASPSSRLRNYFHRHRPLRRPRTRCQLRHKSTEAPRFRIPLPARHRSRGQALHPRLLRRESNQVLLRRLFAGRPPGSHPRATLSR